MVDVTKRDEVEALAMEHDHVDVLFNVAGYRPYRLLLYLVLIVIDKKKKIFPLSLTAI